MSNVIEFKQKPKEEVKKPKTASEYLALCKKELDPNEYEIVLCSIMDKEYYESASYTLQRIVQNYITKKVLEDTNLNGY